MFAVAIAIEIPNFEEEWRKFWASPMNKHQSMDIKTVTTAVWRTLAPREAEFIVWLVITSKHKRYAVQPNRPDIVYVLS